MTDNQRRSVEELSREVASAVSGRPGLLSRLFATATYRQWNADHAEKTSRLSLAQSVLIRLSQVGADKVSEYQRAAAEHAKLEAAINSLAGELENARSELEFLAARNAGTFISTEFFERPHKEKQLTAAWLDDAVARLRNEVFEAAMRLHKAFVDAAAKPLRHNLSALVDGFGSRSLGTPERDALITDLWATLFLVVPVVSTTFASVGRMFGRLPTEALGWLLIDEAGQALPQAAVGAIARTRRAVVVGDPMQIEPVVPLPDHMTNAICDHFKFDPTVFSAPAASAQTLADSATAYFGSFETATGTREVGVPLLVHRRCAEPMFSISNSIAYENLMVQAKLPRPSAIRDVLGPSRWLNVEGPGQEKWCPREGSALLQQLESLKQARCSPDLYVVTPFVVVQDRTRELLRASRLLEGWVDDPARWLRERVGTVHTVQGREAEAVFFVLGAPDPGQRGARGWAGARPNLLNVAATRAKEVIYVIGNRSLWRGTGVFQTLDRFL